jgi:toxin ParE1/3/4
LSAYRLRPRAAADLEEIGDFIASENPQRAITFVDEIAAVFRHIAENPRAFQRRDDLLPGLRQAVHGHYLILFQTDDAGVVIVRVVHGARRLEDLI